MTALVASPAELKVSSWLQAIGVCGEIVSGDDGGVDEIYSSIARLGTLSSPPRGTSDNVTMPKAMNLGDGLRDGVLLCRLVNLIHPGSVENIHTVDSLAAPSREFLRRENVERFVAACHILLGIEKASLPSIEDIMMGLSPSSASGLIATLAERAHALNASVPTLDDVARKPLPSESRSRNSQTKEASPSQLSKAAYREMIVDEIYETESGYVKSLMFLIQAYMMPMRASGCLNMDDLNKLFANVWQIFDFQKKFWKEMYTMMQLPKSEQKIGRLFLEHAEGFKVYTMYCANNPNTVGVLRRAQRSAKFRSFTAEWQQKHSRLFDLPSFLIKPIQRLCRYPLLLKELIKHTPVSYHDYDELVRGREVMHGITMYVNEAKRKIENLRSLIDLQHRVDGWVGTNFYGFGELLEDGILIGNLSTSDGKGVLPSRDPMECNESMLSAPRSPGAPSSPSPNNMPDQHHYYCLLLQQHFVLCKPKRLKRNKYDFKVGARTECITFADIPDSRHMTNALRLSWRDNGTIDVTVTLRCETAAEKDRWMRSLGKVCQEDPDCHNGFVVSSQPRVFGAFYDEHRLAAESAVGNGLERASLSIKEQRSQCSARSISWPIPTPEDSIPASAAKIAADLAFESERLVELERLMGDNVEPSPPLVQKARQLRDRVAQLRLALESAPESSSSSVIADTVECKRRSTIVCDLRHDLDTLGQDISKCSAIVDHKTDDTHIIPSQQISPEDAAAVEDSSNLLAPAPCPIFKTMVSSTSGDSCSDMESEEEAMLASLAEEMHRMRSRCAHCGERIQNDDVGVLALGVAWHRDHFRCTHCSCSLSEAHSYYRHAGRPYCEEDYLRLFNSCRACGAPISNDRYVAIDDEPTGPRWHVGCFSCTVCSESLLSCKAYNRGGTLFCEKDYQNSFGQGCGGCGRAIAAGKYLSALNRQWHPPCFVCQYEGCRHPFDANGLFFALDDNPYCEQHFHKLQGTLCSVCDQPMTATFVQVAGFRMHATCHTCCGCQRVLSAHDPVWNKPGCEDKAIFLCKLCINPVDPS